MQSVIGLFVTAQDLPPAINMGFGAIRADGSRVSTFVFQCCFCSGWTNFFGLQFLTSSSNKNGHRLPGGRNSISRTASQAQFVKCKLVLTDCCSFFIPSFYSANSVQFFGWTLYLICSRFCYSNCCGGVFFGWTKKLLQTQTSFKCGCCNFF